MQRLLVAVDDSIESLAAARTASQLARDWSAQVRLVTVVPEGADEARRRAAAGLLEHVVRQMAQCGLARAAIACTVQTGEPFRRILDEARGWRADLIVMAVSDRRGLRSPYVGSETEHVLEFTDRPVLVVPGFRKDAV